MLAILMLGPRSVKLARPYTPKNHTGSNVMITEVKFHPCKPVPHLPTARPEQCGLASARFNLTSIRQYAIIFLVCDSFHIGRSYQPIPQWRDLTQTISHIEITTEWPYVTLAEVLSVIEGKVVSSDADLSQQVSMACGADLMSDVLAFTHAGTLLLTGLTNPQVIRTAEMAGIVAIVFVRGKLPLPETITLAQEKGIPLLASKYTMYETCGRLYQTGLPSCGLFELTADNWPDRPPSSCNHSA